MGPFLNLILGMQCGGEKESKRACLRVWMCMHARIFHVRMNMCMHVYMCMHVGDMSEHGHGCVVYMCACACVCLSLHVCAHVHVHVYM